VDKDPPAWSTIKPSDSARKALKLLLKVNDLSCGQVSKAYNFFGLQSKLLQEVLSERVAAPAVEVPPPKRRGEQPRTTLKAVAANLANDDSEVCALCCTLDELLMNS
jgi:hypothetical protein